MFPRNMLKTRTEDGYTLIGVILALAITAFIINGIAMTIFQIYNFSSTRTNYIMAVREVQNASHWLILDGQKAATVEPTQDSDGFPLTISWNDSDDNDHEVVYILLMDNKLQRQHYTNKVINPAPDITTIVSRYIDLSNTSCSVTTNDELVAVITATVNIDRAAHTETRTYRIYPRQSLN